MYPAGMTETEALGYILVGLEKQRDIVTTRVAEIEAELRGKPGRVRPSDVKRTAAKDARIARRRRPGMSASGRAAIAAGQAKRWAKWRKEHGK